MNTFFNKQLFYLSGIGFGSGILGATLVLSFWYFGSSTPPSNTDELDAVYESNIRAAKNPEALSVLSDDFVKASEISTRSVVYIKTVSDEQYNSYDLFEFFFGGGGGRRSVLGSGSGVIFTADGYIVTNYHVIENAQRIEVIHEKKSYSGKVVGTDPSSDLAILKVEGKNLPNIRLASSRALKVGEWVLAVGNPFNLTSTVTAGIVSAKGRNIQLLGGSFPLESFIQTDAAINPGNSGGALVNLQGELVGINTAILSRTGAYNGYGFAVPSDIVAKVFNDLIKYGSVQKAFAGVSVDDIDNEKVERFKLKLDNYQGALVTSVQSKGAAERAGLQAGDIILQINDDPVLGKSTFEEHLSYYRPGDKVKVLYKRGTNNQEITLLLENRDGTTDILKQEIFTAESLGADLEPVSKIERDKLGLNSGVRIVKIRGGLFARLRLQEGFIITAINNRPVSQPQEVEQILSRIGGKVTLEGMTKDGTRGYYSFSF
jgi:Do/DeqQ family serine protease